MPSHAVPTHALQLLHRSFKMQIFWNDKGFLNKKFKDTLTIVSVKYPDGPLQSFTLSLPKKLVRLFFSVYDTTNCDRLKCKEFSLAILKLKHTHVFSMFVFCINLALRYLV